LRFVAVKFIFKDDFTAFLRIDGRKVDEREDGEEDVLHESG
jgi:hypothetical protein